MFMRQFLLFLFLLATLNITATEKKVYYVSSTNGNDKNPGTLAAPRKTIHSVLKASKENLDIRLCRGDVFFENISGLKNSKISAYGKGARPVICGFKVLKDVNQWSYNASRNCWMLDLKEASNFAGFKTNDADSLAAWNDIGCIYVPKVDTIIGHIVKRIDLLKNNGDIFVDSAFLKNQLHKNSFRYLYYKGSDPRLLGHICLPVRAHGVSSMTNCDIQDIAVMGFAMHGMCGLRGCTVSNCRLDVIGGSVQIGANPWVRFGNGIEFWSGTYDTVVEDCVISRTYDCGTTIQTNGNITNVQKNITFTHNVIYHCRQAFEHFLNPKDKSLLNYDNCHFTGNICIDNGWNDFDSPEARDAQILSYENLEKTLDISKNIFFGANYFCGFRKPDGMTNNTVYIYSGQYLKHCHWIKNQGTFFADAKSDIDKYCAWSGDNSKITILTKGSSKATQIKKKLMKKVDVSTPELHLERIL
jgi:hypothetical protein